MDDCNKVVKKVKKSVRFDPDSKTLIDDQPDSDEDNFKSDEDMMAMMRDIANSVIDMIDWEHDMVDRHASK